MVEEPLEIRVAPAGDTGPGTSMSITMRTPGQDIELAVGFLHGEGIIRSRARHRRQPHLRPGRQRRADPAFRGRRTSTPTRLQRNFYTTSSCGVCGNASLDAVERMMRSPNVDASPHSVGRADRVAVGARARRAGRVPRDGRPARVLPVRREMASSLDVREDVGRHNALDKLVGARLLAGELPLSQLRAVPVRPRELRAAAEGRRRGHPGGRGRRRALLARHRPRAAHGHPAGRLPARPFASMSTRTGSACNERRRRTGQRLDEQRILADRRAPSRTGTGR